MGLKRSIKVEYFYSERKIQNQWQVTYYYALKSHFHATVNKARDCYLSPQRLTCASRMSFVSSGKTKKEMQHVLQQAIKDQSRREL